MSQEYWVLTKDNLPWLSSLTGLTQDELQGMLDQCERFDGVQIFWTPKPFTWNGIRLSDEIVYRNDIKLVMERLIEDSKRADGE
jgi:hypothetical protein